MNAPDRLHLDARQRAMLAEMHVPVWWPDDAPVATPAPAAVAKRGADSAAVLAQPLNAIVKVANNQGLKGEECQKHSQFEESSSPALAGQPAPSGALETLDWLALQQAVAACRACALCEGRQNTVFGVGATTADWMIVGEAPGEHEDAQGEPFVGQAGKLLDNMLRAMGLSRAADAPGAAYIANVIKCRPPGNRNPAPTEIAQCAPYLRRQVALLQPKIILAMGRFAANALLADSMPDVAHQPLGKLRGQVHSYGGVPVIVTYHPAYLLRNLPEKAKAWADLCLAREVLVGAKAAQERPG